MSNRNKHKTDAKEVSATQNSHTNRNRKGMSVKDKPINDPKWYIPGEDVALIGNISYNLINGITNPVYNYGDKTPGGVRVSSVRIPSTIKGLRMPSVTIMKYMPMYKADSSNSGINYAARRLYALMRKANSGARNYEPADLAVYIGSLESIYLRYTEIARILLLAQKYSLKNRDIPRTAIEACGIDFQDVLNNFNSYVSQLNILAQQINSLAVPGLDIFKRRHVLASNVFLDEPERPTQIIIPVSDCYYNYNPTQFNTGGALIGVPGLMTYVANNGHPTIVGLYKGLLSKALNDLKVELNKLLSDDDTNIISGDIMKAFGDDKLFTVSRVSPDSVLEFVYDELMLSQFMNSTSLDLPNGSVWYNNGSIVTSWDVRLMSLVFLNPDGSSTMVPTTYQAEGNLVTKFVWNPATNLISVGHAAGAAGLLSMDSYILDAYHNNPDSDYTLESTRLLTGVDDSGAIYGTEIVLGWLSYTSSRDTLMSPPNEAIGSYGQIWTWCESVTRAFNLSVAGFSANSSFYGYWTGFGVNSWYHLMNFVNMNYSPRIYSYDGDSSTNVITINLGDISGRFGVSTALLNKSRLNTIHDVAVYSLYTAK